jgi:hypothetical protein
MNNRQQDTGLPLDGEAVYYSALASLDELPTHHMRALVVLNWVKYIIVRLTDDVTPEHITDLSPIFGALCNDFAELVLGLPEKFSHQLDGRPCGKCPACLAGGLASSDTQVH